MKTTKSVFDILYVLVIVLGSIGLIRVIGTMLQKKESPKILIEYQFHDDKSYSVATVDTAALRTADSIVCETDHGRNHYAVFFQQENLPKKETRKSIPMTIVAYHDHDLIVNIITDIPLQKLQFNRSYSHDLQIFNPVFYNLRVMVFEKEKDLDYMIQYHKAYYGTGTRSFDCKIK